jgi:hypothetical protein
VSTDARRYSWAPFEKDNIAAETHGAWSSRKVQPVADEIARSLASVAPWAALPSFSATVRAWSWSEAQAQLLRKYVDEHGMLDDDHQPRPAVGLLDRVEIRAARLRGELGLTPSSWAKLVARLGSADGDAAVAGLERLKAIGAELAARSALPGGDDDDE